MVYFKGEDIISEKGKTRLNLFKKNQSNRHVTEMVFTWSNRKKGDILISHHELSVPYGGENGLTDLEFPENPLHDPLLILTPYTQNKKPRILKYLSTYIHNQKGHS